MDNSILFLILGGQTVFIITLVIVLLVSAWKMLAFMSEVKAWGPPHADKAGRILEDAQIHAHECRELGENMHQTIAELQSIAETASISAAATIITSHKPELQTRTFFCNCVLEWLLLR